MTYVYEIHGGLHDGLRLPNTAFHQAVPLPVDRIITSSKDFHEWQPKIGDEVSIYAVKLPPRLDEQGHRIHHMYLHHTTTITPEMMQS